MALRDLLRGPTALLALSASYVLGRPRQTPLSLARLPLWLLSSIAVAASGTIAAARIGLRARSAPVLRSGQSVLARLDELTTVCTLVSDCHVVAPGAAPCELELDPGQWLWAVAPTSEEISRGLQRVLEGVARRA